MEMRPPVDATSLAETAFTPAGGQPAPAGTLAARPGRAGGLGRAQGRKAYRSARPSCDGYRFAPIAFYRSRTHVLKRSVNVNTALTIEAKCEKGGRRGCEAGVRVFGGGEFENRGPRGSGGDPGGAGLPLGAIAASTHAVAFLQERGRQAELHSH